MENEGKEKTYKEDGQKFPASPPALKVGLIATASALAGGLAVAWWYRETLKKLQNPVNSANLPKTGSFDEEFNSADQDDFDNSEPGIPPPVRE